MDQEIQALSRALAESPESPGLRARLLRARARGRDPELLTDFEDLALLLEALIAIGRACPGLLNEDSWSQESTVALLRGFLSYERLRPRPPELVQEVGREVLEGYLKQRPLVLDPEKLTLSRHTLPGRRFQLLKSFDPVISGLLPEVFEEGGARSALTTRLRYLLWAASRLNDHLSLAHRAWSFGFGNLTLLGKKPEVSQVRSAIQHQMVMIDPDPLFVPEAQRLLDRVVADAFQHIDLTRGVMRPRLRLFLEDEAASTWSFDARPGPWTPLITRLIKRLAPRTPVLYKQDPITLRGLSLDLNFMNTVEGWILLIAQRR